MPGVPTPSQPHGKTPNTIVYRDVRVCQIYEGTSDMQKLILQWML